MDDQEQYQKQREKGQQDGSGPFDRRTGMPSVQDGSLIKTQDQI